MKNLITKVEAGFYGFGYDSSKPDQSDAVFSMGLGLTFVRFVHFATIILVVGRLVGLSPSWGGYSPHLHIVIGIIAAITVFWKIYGLGLSTSVQAYYSELADEEKRKCHLIAFFYGVGSIAFLLGVIYLGK